MCVSVIIFIPSILEITGLNANNKHIIHKN